jgi:hypothetical protein
MLHKMVLRVQVLGWKLSSDSCFICISLYSGKVNMFLYKIVFVLFMTFAALLHSKAKLVISLLIV